MYARAKLLNDRVYENRERSELRNDRQRFLDARISNQLNHRDLSLIKFRSDDIPYFLVFILLMSRESKQLN